MKDLKIKYPTVIAHRGASVLAPESTELAYLLAKKQGADYLEADLQRTKDGQIVIFHDYSLEALSNIKEVFPDRKNYLLENFTYQELRKVDIGSWFNKKHPQKAREKFKGLKILTLEELIDIAEEGDKKTGLFLEFKHPHLYPGIEKETIEILGEKGWLNSGIKNDRLIFLSFSIHSLDKVKKLAADCPRILLINDNMIGRRSWAKWLELASKHANGLGPKGFMAWPWHIAAAHNKGLFVAPYVINQAWQFKILSHFKADAFITDNPALILKFLDRLNDFSANFQH
ncbi:MAG: glycerophosphodiester phosphodiesterase family protein [Halanaerobiaceae bacterium]